jgi:hypothetical protein
MATLLYTGWKMRAPRIVTDIDLMTTYVRIKVNVVKPLDADSLFPVTIDPWSLCYNPEHPDTIEDIEFEITNVSQYPVALTRANWPDTLVEFSLPWAIPAGESATASVRFDEETYTPDFYKSLTFELSDDARTRFTIPITGESPSFPDFVPCE